MKLAVSSYSLWRWRKEQNRTFEQSLEWIQSAGVDAVEFAFIGDEAKELPKRAASLRVYSMGSFSFGE